MANTVNQSIQKQIKQQIGECPMVHTQRKCKTESLEFDGSVEQLQDCIARLTSKKCVDFNIAEFDYGEYSFVFKYIESDADYDARIAREQAAVDKWRAAKEEIVEKYKEQIREEKRKRAEKYKDANYIEFLRLKKIFENN